MSIQPYIDMTTMYDTRTMTLGFLWYIQWYGCGIQCKGTATFLLTLNNNFTLLHDLQFLGKGKLRQF